MISNDNAYANDYRDLGILKAIADKLNICILLIHHLRKMKDDDPQNMISGTTGISGAVDSCYVLIEDRQRKNMATLHCRGRDIEPRELQLQFDKETHIWQLLADSAEQPEQFLDNAIFLLSDFMKARKYFTSALRRNWLNSFRFLAKTRLRQTVFPKSLCGISRSF